MDSEYFSDEWCDEFWQRVHSENVVFPLLNFRKITDPRIGLVNHGDINMLLPKSRVRFGVSAELAEDSPQQIAKVYSEQVMEALRRGIDNALLNGDTENNKWNINGTPEGDEPYLLLDGLRKLPLVKVRSLSWDSFGPVPLNQVLNVMQVMTKSRLNYQWSDFAWILGQSVDKSLGQSVDKFMQYNRAIPVQPLVGQVGTVYDAPIVISDLMPLTNPAGKVGETDNNRGQALCIYRPGWVAAYHHKVGLSIDRDLMSDSYLVTATARIGLAPLSDNAAAVIYNIEV